LSIFFRSTALGELHDKGWGRFYRLVDGSGHWSDLVAIDGRELWRLTLFQLDPDTDASSFDVAGALIRAVGKPFSYEVLSVLPWKRRELVAKSYGKGRVFLGGDAAHQMSPTGGLGMNTGIGDAVDLGWKLAAMLEGWGGGHLLESYELERKPVATASVLASSDTFQYETSLPADPAVAEDSPEGKRARRHLAEALKGRRGAGNERLHESVKLGYCYEGSPVTCPDTEKTMPQSATFLQLCRSGARAPHAWIREGYSTLDLFGDGFVLLKFGENFADVKKIVDAAAGRRVPLMVHDIKDAKIAELYERRLVLVRPDGHVAWRGDVCPADAVAIIDRVRGAYKSPLAPLFKEGNSLAKGI
jgi:hypothetical protein